LKYQFFKVAAILLFIFFQTANSSDLYAINCVSSVIKAPFQLDTLKPSREKEKKFRKRPKRTRGKFNKLLHKFLFRVKYEDTVALKKERQALKNRHARYDNKVIRDIHLKKLDIFGTDIEDTTKVPQGFVNVFNDMHVDTRDNVVERNLLFTEGMLLDASEIEHNERVLRDLMYIKDARVFVVPTDTNAYDVDLIVITKDVFPLSFGFGTRRFETFRFNIDHRNILGFGHELENQFQYAEDRPQKFGYDGTYRVPNMFAKFITGEVRFADTRNVEYLGFNVFRNFLTPDIRYAGGVEVSKQKLKVVRQLDDTSFVEFFTEFNFQDFWIGKAYRSFYNPPVEQIKERLRFVMAVSFSRIDYNETGRPEVSADTNQTFRSRKRYLISAGLSQRDYRRDKLIFAFGRTEDVPMGYLYQLTAGYEDGEFFDRAYFGLKLARGGFLSRYGYLNGALQAGGFVRENSRFQQGVVSASLLYFHPLFRFGRSQLRTFVNIDYLIGIRRFEEEFIDVRDEGGLRGLRSRQMVRGQQKFVVNAETVFFTPQKLAGFRIAVFGFADIAWINTNDQLIFKENPFEGLGLGFRLRNDNLAFPTFQLRIGFFPARPVDQSFTRFNAGTLPFLRLNDFDLRRPEVLDFGFGLLD